MEHGVDDAPGLSVTVGPLPDGVGTPEAERDHVIEFGDATTDDGTSIGLGLVEDVATAHGWTVTVTESEDGGARFEFRNVT